jgi:hypothetical protein
MSNALLRAPQANRSSRLLPEAWNVPDWYMPNTAAFLPYLLQNIQEPGQVADEGQAWYVQPGTPLRAAAAVCRTRGGARRTSEGCFEACRGIRAV